MAESGLVEMLVSVLSVVLFCLCCQRFLAEMLRPVPALTQGGPYTKSALRVGKAYRVFAWGVLMSTFLVALVMSFIEVFTQL